MTSDISGLVGLIRLKHGTNQTTFPSSTPPPTHLDDNLSRWIFQTVAPNWCSLIKHQISSSRIGRARAKNPTNANEVGCFFKEKSMAPFQEPICPTSSRSLLVVISTRIRMSTPTPPVRIPKGPLERIAALSQVFPRIEWSVSAVIWRAFSTRQVETYSTFASFILNERATPKVRKMQVATKI